MRTFYRREWDESSGDAHDDWGTTVFFFEVENGQALRQVVVYANGNVLKYSLDLLDDDFGGLTDQAIDQNEFQTFEVSQAVFDLAWALPRKTDAGSVSPREIDEPVEIVAYDSRWPSWFSDDAAELRHALGAGLLALEHFGSTAVPFLVGKPVVDILVAPRSWPLLGEDRRVLEGMGYESLGEAGVAGREYFRRRALHATNLAVVAIGGPLWQDNLAFRDYLVANPDIARSYGEAKRAAWDQGAKTLLDYSRAKRALVTDLVRAARSWRGSV